MLSLFICFNIPFKGHLIKVFTHTWSERIYNVIYSGILEDRPCEILDPGCKKEVIEELLKEYNMEK